MKADACREIIDLGSQLTISVGDLVVKKETAAYSDHDTIGVVIEIVSVDTHSAKYVVWVNENGGHEEGPFFEHELRRVENDAEA